jgi:predicted amidohydrolase YtcJ
MQLRTLLRGGRVLTPDGWASDVLVEAEHIAAVGDGIEVVADHVLELRGRLVTPAFVDAHVHLAATGFAALGADLSGTTSADEALELIAAKAATTDLSVVLGHGWDETCWTGRGPLTREELDEAAGHRPAYVSRVDIHSAVASTALRAAARQPLTDGVDGWSADGPLTRDAHHAVRDAMNTLLTDDDRRTAISTALRAAARVGIGTVHEIGAPHISPGSDFDLVDQLAASALQGGAALPTVQRYWGAQDVSEAHRLGCLGAAGDLCVDGAIGSRTAALHEAYADDDLSSGHLYLTADEVSSHIIACTEQGLQAGFHVIGDRAVSHVVEGFRAAAGSLGEERVRGGGHRLEHLEMVTSEQLAELARLGVAASVQPVFDAWWGGAGGLYETRLAGRSRGMNPYRSMLEAGMVVAFGSDSPVTPMNPWLAVRAAVHHHDETQRLDARTAVRAHTVAGWQLARATLRPRVSDVSTSRERPLGGEMAVGAPAYLAVWDTGDRPDLGSTDLGNGHLEALVAPGRDLPRCDLTLVAGRAAHDAHQEWPMLIGARR